MKAHNTTATLWSHGILAVLAAQFLSTLADNALLFGAMALLIGLYTLVDRAGAPVGATAAGFGAALSLAIGVLWMQWRSRPSLQQAAPHG